MQALATLPHKRRELSCKTQKLRAAATTNRCRRQRRRSPFYIGRLFRKRLHAGREFAPAGAHQTLSAVVTQALAAFASATVAHKRTSGELCEEPRAAWRGRRSNGGRAHYSGFAINVFWLLQPCKRAPARSPCVYIARAYLLLFLFVVSLVLSPCHLTLPPEQ